MCDHIVASNNDKGIKELRFAREEEGRNPQEKGEVRMHLSEVERNDTAVEGREPLAPRKKWCAIRRVARH